MEILSLILNNKIAIYIWGGAGLVSAIWHVFYFDSKKLFSKKELEKKYPSYANLHNHLSMYFIVWILSLGILYLILSSVSRWSNNKYGLNFYPMYTIFFSCYGILKAATALLENVYPQGKSDIYAYDKQEKIHEVARRQIAIIFLVNIFSTS